MEQVDPPTLVRLREGLGPARDCQHGQLARSCDRCADAVEIAELRKELAAEREHMAELEARMMELAALVPKAEAQERERCATYLAEQARLCPANGIVRATLESCAAVLRLGLVKWA
jgi:multidrug resistance efflux pump